MHKPNLHQPNVAQRQDEVFDVVDAEDRVIGRATRKEVHAKGLWHRAVHVLLFDGSGRVYLQKRSMAKDSSPGCWDSSCSGHLDSGEDYAPAGARELGEEIGVAAKPEQLTFRLKLTPSEQTGWEFVSIYTLRYSGPVSPNPAEVERGEWWRIDDVTRAIAELPKDFTPTFRLHWPTSSRF